MSKQTLLALLMIGLVILFMQTDWYKERAFPQRPVPDSLQTQQKETPPPAVPETAPVPSEMRAQPETTDYVAATLSFAGEDSTEKFVEVLSDLYTARLSTRGGTIVYFGLKKFKSYVGEEVALINGSDPTLDPVFTVEGGRFRFSDHFMQCDVEHVDLRGAREGRWVTFSLEDSLTHRRIQKSYFFSPQSYYLKAVVETEGFGDGFLYGTYRINWKAPLQITELDTVQDVTYAEAMALMNGRNLDEFMIHKGERQVQTTTGIVDWVAKRNKYFEVAVIPLTRKGSEVTYTGYQHQVNHSKKSNLRQYELDLTLGMPRAGQVRDSLLVFLGPLKNSELKQAGVGLENTLMTKATMGPMKFMWPVIKPFAYFSLAVFRALHLFIPNYGLIIIIFSVLVKLLVWPLTHKSYKSMKAMQRIQPLIVELKAKYKNDPRRLQQETMKLYQKHKVNPFGSCLPMLLQMPLLIALFYVFRTAFELRGAAFVLWITDLSRPEVLFHLPFSLPFYGDHFSLFPLLIGVTTYFQSRATMTDPNQKMMLYFMPVFLVLLFNNFPAGLTLYYTLFNVMTIYQQRITGTMVQPAKTPPVTSRERKKRK